jgi:hypothetical protein
MVATDPATLYGYGTWSAIGAGRVLIGIDAGDADFDTLGETGGAKTTAHSHGAGTLATSGGSWHSHGAGTIATVAESSHTHAVGTIDAGVHNSHNHDYGTLAPSVHTATTVLDHDADKFTHSHGISTSGAATISVHDQHRHVLTKANLPAHAHGILAANLAHTHNIAAGQGSHQHGMAEGTTDGAGTYMDRSNAASATTAQTDLATLPAMTASSGGPATTTTEVEGAADPVYTNYETQGAHTLGGSTASVNGTTAGNPVSHSATGPGNHTMTGVTGNGGAVLSHSMTGSTAAGSSHSHGVSGTTADEGAHTHGVSGSTGSDSPSVVQPYLVVAMWQRIA